MAGNAFERLCAPTMTERANHTVLVPDSTLERMDWQAQLGMSRKPGPLSSAERQDLAAALDIAVSHPGQWVRFVGAWPADRRSTAAVTLSHMRGWESAPPSNRWAQVLDPLRGRGRVSLRLVRDVYGFPQPRGDAWWVWLRFDPSVCERVEQGAVSGARAEAREMGRRMGASAQDVLTEEQVGAFRSVLEMQGKGHLVDAWLAEHPGASGSEFVAWVETL